MSNRGGNFIFIYFVKCLSFLLYPFHDISDQKNKMDENVIKSKRLFSIIVKVSKKIQGISNNKAVLNQSLPMKFLKISSSINILFETSNYKSSGIMTFGFLYCKKKSLCHFKDKQQLISRNELDFFFQCRKRFTDYKKGILIVLNAILTAI